MEIVGGDGVRHPQALRRRYAAGRPRADGDGRKYVDREGLRRQLEALKAGWPELRERIRRQIIPFGEVRRRLQLVGAPFEPEQIGVSRRRFRASFEKIPYMRSRYSVVDVAFRWAWMERWLDRLFGRGGIWEIV